MFQDKTNSVSDIFLLDIYTTIIYTQQTHSSTKKSHRIEWDCVAKTGIEPGPPRRIGILFKTGYSPGATPDRHRTSAIVHEPSLHASL